MTTTNPGIYRPPMHPDPSQRGIMPPSTAGIVVRQGWETTIPAEPECCPPPEFRAWPKTPRLFKDMVVTEKIDGTNACVIVQNGEVRAQSRSRLLTVANDNFGFARWVHDNYLELWETLGEGYHYGEWWGSGIQRGYGLTGGEKRFSLFNTKRWLDADLSEVPGLGVVPVLAIHTFDTELVHSIKLDLVRTGSQAAPGFMKPEGVVVFHTASGQKYKSLIENDNEPKSKGGTVKAERVKIGYDRA